LYFSIYHLQFTILHLDILFADQHYVAINKPEGMLVHRSQIAADVNANFAMQLLRNQLKQHVYTVHRLDRPTSGVLLFALSPEAAAKITEQFSNNLVQKRYIAIVRGYTDTEGTIDYALKKEDTNVWQDDVTHYTQLATVELPFATNRYPTARYSLVAAKPINGRMHQIRRHFKHIFHPIIGDTTYGDLKQNSLIAAHYPTQNKLMLAAQQLQFVHPYTQQAINITAPMPPHMQHLIDTFGWTLV
jgi:tRNA pseudouridine65 synthase